ncbi:cellulose-binding domain-containing protein, partial [Streptomyces puniciscabiei]|uniref:cellulose-binding domain-containing protein n=1 Tax=Streptomyces puniciscabiei TaxID=164348 RepID=UPI000B0ADE08
MRHPPRSVLLAAAGAVALVASAVVPVVSAQGATPACTVEYSVTSQWDGGFQGSVRITNNWSALSGWRLTFDFADGQKVTQGWNAQWSQSGGTVSAGNESYNGSLGTGASVTAGFLASWAGTNTAPTVFRLNGTTCNADPEPTPPPTTPPPASGGVHEP